jgi:cytochrome c peroxidase
MNRTTLVNGLGTGAASAALILIGSAGGSGAFSAQPPSGLTIASDPAGLIGTYHVGGDVDPTNAFFQSLGTNGRSCSTCHLADEAMSFTPVHARRLYRETRGADPLFASVDGANCSTVAPQDRAGHSLLLEKGLIRIPMPVPTNAEFSISVVHDP